MTSQAAMTGIRPLVLDFGTGLCKTGFAGDSSPRLIYQSCIQQQEIQENGVRHKLPSIFVGNEDLANGDLIFPIEHGIVIDWDNVEKLWWHAFNKLNARPEDHILLITEAPLNPKCNRERTAEIMFEKYEVPALYFANTAKMCSQAQDVTTGTILELGDGVTAAVPIDDGDIVSNCVRRNDFAGRELTKRLRKLLESNELNDWDGFSCKERFSKKSGIRDVVRKAKEKVCYVAKDFKTELYKDVPAKPCVIPTMNYTPMNINLKIGQEKFDCPECLFEPTRIARSAKGLHELIVNSIEKCDADLREDLYANIVLCGGTAQLPGLVERLKKEMLTLVSTDIEINITRSTDLSCAWTGAATFASSAIFRQMCTNKDKYDELGTEYLHSMAERKSHLNVQAFQFSQ